MNILEELKPCSHYYTNGPEKDTIVIHNTVGYKMRPTVKWFWNKAKNLRDLGRSNITVHYWIGRNGEIVKNVPDNAWGYHTGTGNSGIDPRSISIELANVGPLVKKKNGLFYDYYGNQANCKVFDVKESGHGESWRGYSYYESFPVEQVNALKELIKHLYTSNSGIPKVAPRDFFPEEPYKIKDFWKLKGIISHSHLRSMEDKTDITIAFSKYWKEIVDELGIVLI